MIGLGVSGQVLATINLSQTIFEYWHIKFLKVSNLKNVYLSRGKDRGFFTFSMFLVEEKGKQPGTFFEMKKYCFQPKIPIYCIFENT